MAFWRELKIPLAILRYFMEFFFLIPSASLIRFSNLKAGNHPLVTKRIISAISIN